MQTIAEKKKLFKLPYSKDQIEYWGPVSDGFSDAFLSMGNSFLKNFLEGFHLRHYKEIFSAFVELIQNVAEYNRLEYTDNPPQSYLNLTVEKETVKILTINQVKKKDTDYLSGFFDELLGNSKEELKKKHRQALLDGKSLGLIIILRMKSSGLSYKIQQDESGTHWLSIETNIKYGSTED